MLSGYVLKAYLDKYYQEGGLDIKVLNFIETVRVDDLYKKLIEELEGILTYDGLHPNARGHELIAETIMPASRANEVIKREPIIRRILCPFTNGKDPLVWKTLSRFDKSIK